MYTYSEVAAKVEGITLVKGARWHTGRVKVWEDDGDKFSAIFHATVLRHETVAGFLAEVGEANADRRQDLESGNARAKRTLSAISTAKGYVTKVAARIAGTPDAKGAKVLQDLSAQDWAKVRVVFAKAPNMYNALQWALFGGTPDNPNPDPDKATKGDKKGPQRHKGRKDATEAPEGATLPDWAAEIVETVRLELNDAEAESIANALHLSIERVKRAEAK